MVLPAAATSAFDSQIFHNGTDGISGTTTTGTYNAFPIGFNFFYKGTSFDGFYIGTDGYIKLSPLAGTVANSSVGTPISSTTAGNNDIISAFAVDLVGGMRATASTRTSGSAVLTLTGANTAMASNITVGMRVIGSGIPAGTTVLSVSGAAITMSANATTSSTSATPVFIEPDNISYVTTGTVGSRVLTVQWKNSGRYSAGGDLLNFQIKLYEGTNVIQTVYNNVASSQNTTASTIEVGLKGAVSPIEYNNRTSTAAAGWSGSTAGASSSASIPFRGAAATGGAVTPDSGLTYTWTPPTCIAPTALNVVGSSVTTTGATVSWTAPLSVPSTGYEVYYSTTNTAPTSTTVLNATNSVTSSTTTAPISGLSAATTYYVWVRSACTGTDRSVWTSVFSFTTLCVATNAPYFENFDTTAVGSSSNTNAPTCWKYLEPAGWAGFGYVSTNNTSAPNGYYISTDLATTGGGMLVSPPTANLMNGNNRVRFFASGGGSGYTMEVGTLSNPFDASTFVAIGSPISLTTTFVQYTVNIPSGANQYVAFRHTGGGTSRSIRLDDINVELIPSCVEPTAIVVSNITNGGATVAWTAPATVPANGYEYFYSTTNTAPTAATVASGSSTGVSTAISGLTANTTYYLWVRSVCTTSTSSAWSLMATFTTACNVYVPNYTNNFATFPGLCWSRANGGTPATTPGTDTTNYWLEDGFLNVGSTGAAKINLYSNGRNGWLLSPSFNLSAGGYRVKFDYGLTTYAATTASAMGSDDVVQFVVSTDGGSTWTVLQTWNAANAPSNTLNQYTLNLTSYTGANTKFALFGSDGAVDDAEDYDFFVDNFTVETIPSCEPPTAITSSLVTTSSATISWTAPATVPANGYEYYYSTSNTAPTAATAASGTSTAATAPLSGLASATTYYVWVRSVCSTSSSSVWSTSGTFTTLCNATGVPYTLDFTSVTTPALPTCTSAVNSGSGNTWVTYSPGATGFTGNVLNYTYNLTNAANTWFFTQGINLTAGTAYRIQYKYGNNGGTTYPEKLKVAYGTSATSASMTNPLVDNGNITNTTAANAFADFVPATTGVYYFGFQAYSDANMNRLYVDDINIDVAPSCSEPTALVVSNVTTTAANLAWTAPATAPASGYEVYYSTTSTAPIATTTPTLTVTTTSTPLSPLATGTTYYVWVRSNCGATKSVWTPVVSFTTLIPAPANDNCSAPITITPGATFAQNPLTGTTVGSTNTPALTATCLATPTNVGGNVWYTVVVPASGSLTIETAAVTGSPLTDTVVSVFASCSSTTSIGCDDDSGTDAFSKLTLTGQTPGTTLYISVWKYSTATDGQFQISAYDASLATSETVQVKNDLKIYPNPFADVLNISDVKNVKSVSIVDIAGRLVKTIDKPSSALQLRDLNSGMYMVILNMNDGSKQTIKAIKK
jgi:hypothetical protein